MKQPEGLKYVEDKHDEKDEEVLILDQSIYVLVQAVRQFLKKLRDILIDKIGFENV